MSNVIEVLMEMASNAEMGNKQSLDAMLASANITEAQELALKTNNIDSLKETIYDLPEIRCYPILLPEDQNEEAIITLINKVAANF